MFNQTLNRCEVCARPWLRGWSMVAVPLVALLAAMSQSRVANATEVAPTAPAAANSVTPSAPPAPAAMLPQPPSPEATPALPPSDPQSSAASLDREPLLLAENRALEGRVQALSSVLQQVSRLVGAEGSTPEQTLEKLRALANLRHELARTARSYVAPLAGDPPRTPELLLQELTRLHTRAVQDAEERDDLRARLAERERGLAKALPEIQRVLVYQRELKELRAEAARCQPAARQLIAQQPTGLVAPASAAR
jgi:hypothetical protein